MGNVYNGNALALEHLHDLEQRLHLRVRQRRGGLVHDQHLHVPRQRLGDLHQLHIGDGQILDRLSGVDLHVHAVQYLLGAFFRNRLVKQYAAPKLLPHENILGNAQLRHHIEFLIDHMDTQLHRLVRLHVGIGRPFKDDLAVIRLDGTGERLDQGGLPRAVFAHQGVYLAPAEADGNIVQSLYAGILLTDMPELQNVPLFHWLFILSRFD